MPGLPTRAECAQRDASDPLAALAAHFSLPAGVIYLDGNSLGAPPKAAAGLLAGVIEQEWGQGLVQSWSAARWWEQPRLLGDRLAALIGAAPGQVILGDSTSVNLFKVLVAALGLRPGRRVVVSEADNFPTDLYLLHSVATLLGIELRLVEREEAALAAALDEEVAAVVVTHVDYRSAHLLDMTRLTGAAHDAGALMVFDLCHSVGALPLAVDDCGVDFAVGCTYKYLNGGPGSPAFVYCAERHLSSVRQPLAGWAGHVRPFEFEANYAPAPGIERFLAGSPQILSLRAIEASLDVFEQVSLEALWEKSRSLSELLIALVEAGSGDFLALASPRDATGRGSHVSFRHPEAKRLHAELAARGVIGDFRPPDLLRLGLAPLYLSYCDIFDAASTLCGVVMALEETPR